MSTSEISNADTSPVFQLLAKGSGFPESARIVVDSGGNKKVLLAPVNHLIAHGLEVLLKHHLMRQGHELSGLRKTFGHDIWQLWSHENCVGFRNATQEEATQAWREAKASGKFRDDFLGDPFAELEGQIRHLSKLHTRASDFALRYVHDVDEVAPLPIFLLDVFQAVKDRLARSFSRSDHDI